MKIYFCFKLINVNRYGGIVLASLKLANNVNFKMNPQIIVLSYLSEDLLHFDCVFFSHKVEQQNHYDDSCFCQFLSFLKCSTQKNSFINLNNLQKCEMLCFCTFK